MLVNALDSHPQISCAGEQLHDLVPDPLSHMSGFEQNAAPVAAFGFKLLSYQLRRHSGVTSNRDLLARLLERDYRVIYLRRVNNARHAISNMLARVHGRFHSTAEWRNLPSSVRLDPVELKRWIEGSRQLELYEFEVLSGVDHLALTYETHLMHPAAHQNTANTVFEFLELPAAEVETQLVQNLAKPLHQLIDNYDQIQELARNAGYTLE